MRWLHPVVETRSMTARLARLIFVLSSLGLMALPAACHRPGAPVPRQHAQGAVATSGSHEALPTNLASQAEAAIQARPTADAQTHLWLADTLKAEERYEEAAAHYLAALKLQPHFPQARYKWHATSPCGEKRCSRTSGCRQALDDGFWGYER